MQIIINRLEGKLNGDALQEHTNAQKDTSCLKVAVHRVRLNCLKLKL